MLPPHRAPLRIHPLRLRRHQPRRRGGRLRPRLQGVPPRGLLQLAAEARGEHQELEQDQELPPGLQGLQELAGQEGDVRRLHPLRPLTHPGMLMLFFFFFIFRLSVVPNNQLTKRKEDEL